MACATATTCITSSGHEDGDVILESPKHSVHLAFDEVNTFLPFYFKTKVFALILNFNVLGTYL